MGYGKGHGFGTGRGRGYGYGKGFGRGRGAGAGYSWVKYLFFTFNVLFWLLGCAILGTGIWLQVSKGSYASLSSSFNFQSATVVCIIVEVFILLIGFFGCGAIMENICLLVTLEVNRKEIQLLSQLGQGQFGEVWKVHRRIVVALYPYKARDTDDLSFNRGDRMEIIDASDNDWLKARKLSTQEVGYVPSNYIAEDGNIVQKQDWWFSVDRRDAEKKLLLQGNPRGTFLIRCSADKRNYALSVRDFNDSTGEVFVRHYKIKVDPDTNQHYIALNKAFPSLIELVECYKGNAHGLCTRLVRPCPREPLIVPFRELEVNRKEIELVSQLGQGQFGKVWKGKWRKQIDVAVKMMKIGTMNREDFIEEARKMHSLRHVRVVQIMGVCTDGMPMYIIMELMAKGALLDYLSKDKGRTVGLKAMIDMASDVTEGLAFLETKNVVHRDIRAANILVGANESCKVANFGLAKIMDEEMVYVVEKNAKFPVKWTSPEAAIHKKFSSKSDVWSFGILMYEIVTYCWEPYPGMTNHESLERVQEGYRMPRPTGCGEGHNFNCPQPIYEIMLKCWNSRPANRPTFEYLKHFFEEYPAESECQYSESDNDWLKAKKLSTQKVGYVPSNCIADDRNIVQKQDWWFSGDRRDAEKRLLLHGNQRGTFLIRDSTDKRNYALSVRDFNDSTGKVFVRHYKIEVDPDTNQHYIAFDNTFPSLMELVECYKGNACSLCTRLVRPCPREPLIVPFMELEVNRKEIQLQSQLGQGQFGVVWKGKSRKQIALAVKTMKIGTMSREDFIEEARKMHSLRHCRLVQIMGVCTDGMPIYIITELMAKGTLLDYLWKDNGRTVGLKGMIDMASDVTEGLAFLETKNVVHRDIRAANILVGANGSCKVADFGLAKILDEEMVYAVEKNAKFPVKRTFPEAAIHKKFSFKSDVWSFGILMYEICREPYPGMSNHESLERAQRGYRMPRPTGCGEGHNFNCPQPIYEIMLKCWNSRPANRPTFEYLKHFFEEYPAESERQYSERW